MTITQQDVEAIIAKAKTSDLGLNEPKSLPHIGKYADQKLHSLGLLLIECWDEKYDLCAVTIAALEHASRKAADRALERTGN